MYYLQLRENIKRISPPFLLRTFILVRNAMITFKWVVNGFTVPPPHFYKQIVIKRYRRRYNYKAFIETGTYLGDMVEAQRKLFRNIISIELNDLLFHNAVERFAGYKHIKIINGDSGRLLKELLLTMNEPAIFWLDGHYSGGITSLGEKVSPIIDELTAILNHECKHHVILIDDARLFVKDGGYPTIAEIEHLITLHGGSYITKVKHDIIRCTPAFTK